MPVKSSYPVTMNWVDSDWGYPLPIIYDNKTELVDEFNAYLFAIAKQKIETGPSAQAYRSGIDLHAYSLKSFLSYLCGKGLDWRLMDDDGLVAFRDWLLDKTQSDSKSKGQTNPAKRTTNRKLRVIYNFFVWAQDTMNYTESHIGLGSDFPINSALARFITSGDIKSNDERLYPKCFRRCGEGSRTRNEYSATPEDKAKLIKHFTDTCSPYFAERNILIMELSDQVGWRRGSIACLTTDLFSEEQIYRANEDHILVRPSIQKLGYENYFEVPLALASRIAKHIKTTRDEFIRKKLRNLSNVSNDLFLSGKNCEGLGLNTISQIFSNAMREIGCPPRSSIHSFRRKFAQDTSDKEAAFRRAHKLSLASEDIGMVVARKLGQSNVSSQEAYIKSMAVESEKTIEAKLIQENHAMASQLADAELENARLRMLIEHMENNSE